jgi:hypothetical protein
MTLTRQFFLLPLLGCRMSDNKIYYYGSGVGDIILFVHNGKLTGLEVGVVLRLDCVFFF